MYKSFGSSGFNVLSEEFKFLEEDLSFIHMTDVSFVVCQEKLELMKATGQKLVHAWAHGFIQAALPKLIIPHKDKIALMDSLPEVDYNPYAAGHFYLTKTGQEITSAKEIYAFNKIVRVVI